MELNNAIYLGQELKSYLANFGMQSIVFHSFTMALILEYSPVHQNKFYVHFFYSVFNSDFSPDGINPMCLL